MIKFVPMSKGLFAIVDSDDFEKVTALKWYADKNGYAVGPHYDKATKKTKTPKMHRLICNCPKGYQVDHINGDVTDNRKSNLRICSASQNKRNSPKSAANTSGYKGVSWAKRQRAWKVTISRPGYGNIFLGYFKDITEAAKIYDAAAIEYHGEFARPNFLENNKCES